MHAAAPVAALKVSAAHAVGTPPFGPVYPAAAIQSVLAVEPVPVVPELLGHAEHAAAPEAALNFPVPQLVQEPIDPVVPAAHPVVKV
jgi:hypothetical protein